LLGVQDRAKGLAAEVLGWLRDSLAKSARNSRQVNDRVCALIAESDE
jgi:hypothetical protein